MWVKTCIRRKQDPLCPTCRGPLQVHGERMGNYLRQNRAALAPEDVQVLEGLQQSGSHAAGGRGRGPPESSWETAPVRARDLSGVLGQVAGGLRAMGRTMFRR